MQESSFPKGRFPLSGIFRAERNFSLSCNFSVELIKKDKENFRSAREIPPIGKRP
jgi:hypothetical protein